MQHSILLYATITTYIFTILIMVFHFTAFLWHLLYFAQDAIITDRIYNYIRCIFIIYHQIYAVNILNLL